MLEDGRQARFLFLDDGEDPDTLVRKLGTHAFESLLSDARPVEKFLFDLAADKLDMDSLEGKARFAKRAMPLVQQLPTGVFKQLMLQALAEKAGIDQGALNELAQTQSHKPKPSLPIPEPEIPKRNEPLTDHTPVQRAKLVTETLRLLLQRPEIAAAALPDDIAVLSDNGETLLSELLTLLKKQPQSNAAMLLGHWYGTPEGELLAKLMGDETIIPYDGVPAQFSDCLQQLTTQPKIRLLQTRLNELSRRDIQALNEQEKSEIRELLREKRALETAVKKSTQKH